MIIKQFNNNQENVTTHIKNNSEQFLDIYFMKTQFTTHIHRVLKVYT